MRFQQWRSGLRVDIKGALGFAKVGLMHNVDLSSGIEGLGTDFGGSCVSVSGVISAPSTVYRRSDCTTYSCSNLQVLHLGSVAAVPKLNLPRKERTGTRHKTFPEITVITSGHSVLDPDSNLKSL